MRITPIICAGFMALGVEPVTAGQEQGWVSRVSVGPQLSNPTSVLQGTDASHDIVARDFIGGRELSLGRVVQGSYFLGFQFTDTTFVEAGMSVVQFPVSVKAFAVRGYRDELWLPVVSLGVNHRLGGDSAGVHFGPFIAAYPSTSINSSRASTGVIGVHGGLTWGAQAGVYAPFCITCESAIGLDVSVRYSDLRFRLADERFSRVDATPWVMLIGVRYSH